MRNVGRVNELYANAASILRDGVELFAVGDPGGAGLNAAVRRMLIAVRDDGPELWGDLLGAAKALRWRLICQPQPLAHNPSVLEGVIGLRREVGRLRSGVSGEAMHLLDDLEAAADGIGAADPPAGEVLLRCIEEVGGDCVVVCESLRAVVGVNEWLADTGVAVLIPSALRKSELADMPQAYAIGPPRIFGAALITAPPVAALSFVVPAWFADRGVPHTLFAPLASGGIRVPVTVREEGDLAEPSAPPDTDIEDELRPLPVWRSTAAPQREPGHDEVVAHKVLLGGGRAIYLDEAGDRIRALDPLQPAGERVSQLDVAMVRPGTFLVLREGLTEPRVLYDRTMTMLGAGAAATQAAQQRWKSALQERFDDLGHAAVENALRQHGVQRAGRAHGWVEQTVVRPRRNEDFEGLLQWLDIPVQPTYTLATNLRRLRGQASADVREQLERAVSEADLAALESNGFIRLDLDEPGFSGIIAARVLAIAPHATVVPRWEARLPMPDRSAQWLE